MRFAIRRGALVRPLVGLFGGTKGKSYVEIEGRTVRLRFGPLFDVSIPLENVASAERAEWPLLGGLGWRTNFVDSVGLVGSYQGVVRLTLKRRVPMRLLVPLEVDRVYVSLEEPMGFLAEMGARLDEERAADRAAAAPEAHA